MSNSENKIRTVQWTEKDWRRGEPDLPPMRSSHWLRINSPAVAWKYNFDDCWDHHVQDTRGAFDTASTWDIIRFDKNRKIDLEYQVAKVLAPVGAKAECWSIEMVNHDRHELLKHSREKIEHNFRVVRTILSDPDAGFLVRREIHEFDARTGVEVRTEVCSEYVYNSPIPDDVFEMPGNLPVEEPNLDELFPDLWPNLGTEDKQAIVQAISNSEGAWLNGDCSKFAHEWRFRFQSKLPTKQEWFDLIKKHDGLWRRWESSITEMQMARYIAVQVASDAFVMRPTKGNNTFRIRTTCKAEWADNGDVWEGKADYYLINDGKRYKIVHWEFPLEEMKAAHAGKRLG